MADAFTDMGFAKPDHDRAHRTGVGEVVYGEGKTAEQISASLRLLQQGNGMGQQAFPGIGQAGFMAATVKQGLA